MLYKKTFKNTIDESSEILKSTCNPEKDRKKKAEKQKKQNRKQNKTADLIDR